MRVRNPCRAPIADVSLLLHRLRQLGVQLAVPLRGEHTSVSADPFKTIPFTVFFLKICETRGICLLFAQYKHHGVLNEHTTTFVLSKHVVTSVEMASVETITRYYGTR
jgi:hypothetical protein